MGKSLISRIPFVKIVIVLAVAFGISCGLCGVTFVLALGQGAGNSASSKVLNMAVPVELTVMVISGLGLVVTVIAWVVVAVFGVGREKDQPQRLFDNNDDENRKDPR
jgi:phosphate/sulfate permease